MEDRTDVWRDRDAVDDADGGPVGRTDVSLVLGRGPAATTWPSRIESTGCVRRWICARPLSDVYVFQRADVEM